MIYWIKWQTRDDRALGAVYLEGLWEAVHKERAEKERTEKEKTGMA